MEPLEKRLAAIMDKSSYLWMFFHSDEADGTLQMVEARLDLPGCTANDFVPPVGWTLHMISLVDSFFIRSTVPISESAVAEMLNELTRYADGYGGRLHSWLHGSENIEDQF